MTTRLRKNRKKRGHVSAGCGRIGKHRKHFGGRGNAGGMHHHRILIINVDKLGSLVPQEVKDKASTDNIPLINVTQFRYFKVLGKKVLLESKPVVLKVKFIDKTAEKKIKEAGGVVILAA